MALSRFWLINGSKKKGKKSSKKISKKIAKKLVKKTVVKPTKKVAKKVVKAKVYVAKPAALPVTLMTSKEKNKNIRSIKKMAKRRIKRSVAKATKRVKRAKRRMDTAVGRHRVVAIMDRAGSLRTSKKSKIAKRNFKINPFKFSAKGIVNELKPAIVLGSTSVGTVYGLEKLMPKIPYVNTVTNAYAKAALKIALGLATSMGLRKVWKTKNNSISNGILVGSVIAALMDFIPVAQAQTTAGIKLNGIKVLGNPLNFGRPKTALGNPSFTMNGIKIKENANMGAIKINGNSEQLNGCERY